MKKSGKWFKSAIVLMSLTFVLAACGGNNNAPASVEEEAATNAPAGTEASAKLETVDLTLVGVRDAQISSQQIIADKLGYFKEEGLNVTSQLIESGPDILDAVLWGTES